MNCRLCASFISNGDGFGSCNDFWARLVDGADVDGLRTDKLHIQDQSDLLVGEDFGCVHYNPAKLDEGNAV
jgi:hypothetical protein